MKNLNEPRIRIRNGHPWRFDLKMKLTSLFLFVALFQIQASSYSQNTKIDLNLRNVSVQDVLNEIESLTEFKFFVDTKEVDLKRTVSINVRKKTISPK